MRRLKSEDMVAMVGFLYCEEVLGLLSPSNQGCQSKDDRVVLGPLSSAFATP